MRNGLAAVLVLTAIGLAAAQAGLQPQATGTGAIVGRVVEAGTDKPVANARLWMHQTRGETPRGVYPRSDNITTDSTGAFEFRNLPAGQFSIDASADGYQSSAIGKRRPDSHEAWITLKDGQTFSNATIEMFRGGTISGIVTNDRGEPMRGVHVGTWQRIGNGELKASFGGETDASGAYRISPVLAGDYFVLAGIWHATVLQAPPDFPPCTVPAPLPPGAPPRPPVKPEHADGEWFTRMSQWIPEPGPDAEGRARTVPSTMYPGVSEVSQAQVVTILGGEDRTGIDLQLRPTTTTTIHGRVEPLPGQRVPKGSEVTLRFQGAPPDTTEHTTQVQADKTFRFMGVPPGQYVLELQLQEQTSCDSIVRSSEDIPTEMFLDVPATGLTNLVVEAATGKTLKGQIRFDGKSPQPMHTDIWLIPTVGDKSTPLSWDHGTTISGDGLLLGNYVVRASDNALEARWFTRSTTIGSIDLVTRPLVIDRDNASGLEITMTDRPSPLEGQVVDSAGRVVRDSTVVVFPVNRATWPTAHAWLAGFAQTRSLDGTYRFEHLVPGDYFIAAVDERRMGDWPRTAFLEVIAKQAAPVRIAPGESRTLKLTLAREKD